MFDVISLGIVVADVMAKPIDSVPEEDKLALFDRMEIHIGGCAANTAIALSRLGTKVKVIGKVGADAFGDFVINTLGEHKVDASSVVRDPSVNTAFTFAMISSRGRRRFLHTMGADATFGLEDIEMKDLRGAQILHVAGTYLMSHLDGQPTAELLREARRMGLKTSLDTAYNDQIKDWRQIIAPCLPHIDYFLPSIEEAEKITGQTDPQKIARVLAEDCPGTIAIKLGSQGLFLKTRQVEKLIPPYQVKVVDTSGAGDCFVAGFLRGLLEGWDEERCARLGNAVASFCIQAIGCTTGVVSWQETVEFIENS
jgi:sugar/nucleoside kinase (ribokinase family)